MYGVYNADRQWALALEWRLGVVGPRSLQMCQSRKADEDQCGQLLDPETCHEVICACGLTHIARHNDLADVYADIIQEVGAITRREV